MDIEFYDFKEHIPSVEWVFLYDLPEDSKNYIHRVGRTARAGKSGRSLALVT